MARERVGVRWPGPAAVGPTLGAKRATPPPLLLAECVPGGTSTARRCCCGLGIGRRAGSAASNSRPIGLERRPWWERGLRAACPLGQAKPEERDPLAVVAAVGIRCSRWPPVCWLAPRGRACRCCSFPAAAKIGGGAGRWRLPWHQLAAAATGGPGRSGAPRPGWRGRRAAPGAVAEANRRCAWQVEPPGPFASSLRSVLPQAPPFATTSVANVKEGVGAGGWPSSGN